MLKIKYWLGWSLFFLLSGCAMFRHGEDPNYTLCKTLQGKIQFNNNTTLFSANPTSTYSQTAAEINVEKRRLQATYEKLNCSRYQWLTF